MRADIVHVTDHALLRWRERAARYADATVHDIIRAVKESRQLKSKEPLPYPMPRLSGSVYSVLGEILFVMEPITITEFRLVTVITGAIGNNNYVRRPLNFQKRQTIRDKLIQAKEKAEKRLSKLPKKEKREFIEEWLEIERAVVESKYRPLMALEENPAKTIDSSQCLEILKSKGAA